MVTLRTLAELEAGVRDLGADFNGHCTFAVTHLGTGEHFGIDQDEPMATASVIKVPILIAVYRAVAEGRVALEDRIKSAPQHNVIGSGVLNKLSLGVEMALRDAAVLMTIISDNVATNMCIDHIGGIEYVNETMRMLGLQHSTMFTRLGDPSRGLDGRDHYVMTAREACRLWELIARGEAISAEACEDMLRILRCQQHREKLARFLPWNELNMLPDPANHWVANKGGTYIQGVRNDTALMHGARGEIVVAVFTERGLGGSGTDHVGNVFIGRIGQLVWQLVSA